MQMLIRKYIKRIISHLEGAEVALWYQISDKQSAKALLG